MCQNFNKKIRLNHFKKICWCFFKKKIFLVLTTHENLNKYILIPSTIKFVKTSNIYFINDQLSNCFYSFILKWSEQFIKPLQKKLFFKGLGIKLKYSNFKKDKLEFKLGFSHITTILIPKKNVKVFLIKKNRLAIEGFDYSLVGNFAQKIKMLRFPDSYNGKGFWYKNEVMLLKPVKKT